MPVGVWRSKLTGWSFRQGELHWVAHPLSALISSSVKRPSNNSASNGLSAVKRFGGCGNS